MIILADAIISRAESGPPPEFIVFVAVWLPLGLCGSLFFHFNRNAALKRKLLLAYAILADEESVIEAASQGIRDAEKDLHWSGEPHSLISLEGLLVDGIDAKAARIATHKATESLIQNR